MAMVGWTRKNREREKRHRKYWAWYESLSPGEKAAERVRDQLAFEQGCHNSLIFTAAFAVIVALLVVFGIVH